MKRFYPDSNFLTAFLYENHEFHQKAYTELEKILLNTESTVLISTLVFDETWMALHKCSEESRLKSFRDFSEQAEEIFRIIREDTRFHIIETANSEKLLEYAFIGARKYNLRPRDAFHYAYVKMWDAVLLTFDTDFASTDLKKI